MAKQLFEVVTTHGSHIVYAGWRVVGEEWYSFYTDRTKDNEVAEFRKEHIVSVICIEENQK